MYIFLLIDNIFHEILGTIKQRRNYMLTSINNTFFNRNIATTKMKDSDDMVSTKVAQLVEEKKI